MKRIRLRTKFLLIFGAIALVPFITTLALTYSRLQKALEEDSFRFEAQLANTAASRVKSFIVSQISILNTLSTLYDQEFSTQNDTSGKIISNILYRSDNFLDISIVNKSGQEIIRQNRILVFHQGDFRNLANTESFERVKENGLYVGPIYIREGKPLFELGRWIVDSQGNFSGAVFAQVDAKIMPDVMQRISAIAGPGGRVFMVDAKGTVVAHPDLSYILGEKNLSSLPSIKPIIEQSTTTDSSQKYLNEKSEEVLGSAYPIILSSPEINLPEPFPIDWFVVVEQQQDVVLAEANRVALFFILISIIVLALIVGASIFFARRISAPVESLVRATTEFGKGNLQYRTNIKNNDEIGDLAKNFDQMAETVAGSIEHLKESEKMKSEFVTIAAHQLRTPLTGIKWALSLLLSEQKNMDSEQKKTLVTLSGATDQMINLVNDLLNISQIEEGRFGIKLRRESLVPVLGRIQTSLRESLNQNVKLEVDIPSELPLLDIDPQKIEIALNNILNNAFKYSRPGGTVHFSIVVGKKEIFIAIKDSGIGINKEEFPRIFTKFFRSSKALLQHTDGTGLGLYVGKNIIEGHKGKIWFESEENVGTTFFISLPIPV